MVQAPLLAIARDSLWSSRDVSNGDSLLREIWIRRLTGKSMTLPVTLFDDADHELFMSQGYLRLGKVASADQLLGLQQRIDAIMLGSVRYEHMRMQLFDEASGELRRTMGNEVSTLSYRRIDDLEQDPLFLAYMQTSAFEALAHRYAGAVVSVFRSMFMNKPR